MKKIIVTLLCGICLVLCAFALLACGDGNTEGGAPPRLLKGVCNVQWNEKRKLGD